VVVRRLGPADAEIFMSLRLEALDTDPASFGSAPGEDRALDPDFAREFLADTAQAVFGAFGPGLVGIVGVYLNTRLKSAHKAHIWGMYVSPRHRGSGRGRSLMEAAIEFARACAGITQIHLSVSETAAPALALYEELGFVAWGTEPCALRMNQDFLDEHHMVLSLTDTSAG
jgi:ribosomal protein S18 acetylase RimI-like enzyme